MRGPGPARPERARLGMTLEPLLYIGQMSLHKSLGLEGVARALERVKGLLVPALFRPVGLHPIVAIEPGSEFRG